MKELVLPVRVYLEDTDAQGVVYNASYFRSWSVRGPNGFARKASIMTSYARRTA